MYNRAMRFMHWFYAIVVVSILSAGLYMTGLQDSDTKWEIYGLHKSFGMFALLLVVLRISIRLFSYIPALPNKISKLENIFAKIGVLILYALMLIMPLSGYIMSSASGRDVPFFFTTLPNFAPLDGGLAGLSHFIHVNAYYILIAVIVLHALSGFKHLIFDKVNLFKRMWATRSIED